MNYGYARVSTKGQSLADQVSTLRKYDVENKNIFKEKITGTNAHRPQFQKLMRTLRRGDTLTVTKLDRFARNTEDALHWLKELHNREVTVKILNFGTVENTPIGKFAITMLAAVADLERSFIVERTQEGKRYAKQHKKNFKEGRPARDINGSVHNIPYEDIYNYFKQHSAKETIEHFNGAVSQPTIYRIAKMYKEYDVQHHQNPAKNSVVATTEYASVED